MPLNLRCECGKDLLVKSDLIGRQIKCPECVRIFAVPSTAKEGPEDADSARVEVPYIARVQTFRSEPSSRHAAVDFWANSGKIVAVAHDKLYEVAENSKAIQRVAESLKAGLPAGQALAKHEYAIRLNQICKVETNLHNCFITVSWKAEPTKNKDEDETDTLIFCPDRESRDEIVQTLFERLGTSWVRTVRQKTLLQGILGPLALIAVCALLTVSLAIAADWLANADLQLRGGGRWRLIARLVVWILTGLGPRGVSLLGALFVLFGVVWFVMRVRKPPRMLTLTPEPKGAPLIGSSDRFAKDEADPADIFISDEPRRRIKPLPLNAEIRLEYKRRMRRQVIVPVVGIAMGVILYLIAGPDWAKGAVLLIGLPLLGFTFWNWRCPACNGYLGKGTSHRFCPKCGVQLKD